MVEVTVCGRGKLKSTEADVVKCLVVDAIGLISVLYKLVNREGGIVWFHDCIRHLRGWHYAEGVHDSVGILFANLGDEQRTHTGASATTKGVSELEALETVTALSLLTNHIKNRVYQLSPFCVVTFCPVVASTTLTCMRRCKNRSDKLSCAVKC